MIRHGIPRLHLWKLATSKVCMSGTYCNAQKNAIPPPTKDYLAEIPRVPSLRNPAYRSMGFTPLQGGGCLQLFFFFSALILDGPLPRSRKLINPVQPTLCWYAEVCLQQATACALLWRRETEAVCAQQPAGRGRSRGREHKSVLPGFTEAEGPQLQTPLNLLTVGGRCGATLGKAGICNHAL